MDLILAILEFLGDFLFFGGKDYLDDKRTRNSSKIPKPLFYIIGITLWIVIIILIYMIGFFIFNLIKN